MGSLAFFGVPALTDLGGAGMDSLRYAVVIEVILLVCAILWLCVSVHNSVVIYPFLAFGSEEEKQKMVPPLARIEKISNFCLMGPNARSEAAAIEATAVRYGDHYVVNANKVFGTNGGIADACLFFVRTDLRLVARASA